LGGFLKTERYPQAFLPSCRRRAPLSPAALRIPVEANISSLITSADMPRRCTFFYIEPPHNLYYHIIEVLVLTDTL
jgi:hypothetical protein